MEYKIKKRIRVITENTTITDADFFDWMAVNTGYVPVQVDKITLNHSEGIPFMNLSPNCKYDSPIQIVILADGGEVTLYQLLARKQ